MHVPIITDPAVRFVVGEREWHLAPGEVWVFNTWALHNVINPNPTRRIHLVVDTVGGATFNRKLAEGWRPFNASGRNPQPAPAWPVTALTPKPSGHAASSRCSTPEPP